MYEDASIVTIPEAIPVRRCQENGIEVEKDITLKIHGTYHDGYTKHGMTKELAAKAS